MGAAAGGGVGFGAGAATFLGAAGFGGGFTGLKPPLVSEIKVMF